MKLCRFDFPGLRIHPLHLVISWSPHCQPIRSIHLCQESLGTISCTLTSSLCSISLQGDEASWSEYVELGG
ncbi:hypothetical protein F0562_009923 [Nyssa sinensis]|uniref:Uncharacterized protein n=1 Tax=Nyssa sinensis TaxID=561372 RepID=A0A5J4ZZ29_9ASTE|nr:hypothetical protein F0562_009923 [Nyssa sinensis]